ncbi:MULTISPECIES: trigger factor [unclassified Adlercreutzia]|uniref:trigger factor n=1 Tax=unclassified Adlercreutzia TaxID=2636013 RepID=UPI0013EE3BC6|nr:MULTISPECIES: trigger factor [unclassified Adlercreutzia]
MQVKDRALEDDGERQELVLTITASAEEVDASAKEFFGQIAQRDLKGFRKGKAPRAILEQSVGGHANAMGGVAETLINELAFKAIDGADVIFIEEPQFNVTDQLEEGRPFTFTVSGLVAPAMKLTSCEPVSIEMPPEEVTDEEVDSQLAELQDYYHSFEEIADPDHVAEPGDYMMAVVSVDNHGKVISGLSNASRMIGLGEGIMPASFDEKIYGAKAGDTLEFDFEAKDAEGGSDFGDGELHAAVEIKSFRKRILPAIDDELAAKVGCTSVEDMRKQMRHSISVQKGKDLPKLKVDRVIDAVIERLDGEVPGYYVDFIRQDVGRELMQSLEKQGTNLQQWMLQNSIQADQMKEDVATEAQRRAAIDCALEALFRELGLELTDADIDKMFEGDDDPAATRAAWEKANRMADVRKMCRQTKATDWLVENAQVTVVADA